MKKRMYLVGLVALLAMPMQSSAQNWFGGNSQHVTASKKTVTTEVNLRAFQSIEIIGCGDIDLTAAPAGTAPKGTLTMPDNFQDIVQVYVKDDVLYFKIKKGYSISISNTPLKLAVTAPMVKSMKITGSGDFDLLNDATVDHDVEFTVVGSGDIEARSITCDKLSLSISGSGDIDINKVEAKRFETLIAGSGDVEAKSVQAREVYASISGSGDIELKGKTDTAELRIAGSGDLKAHNLQARSVDASVAGSGDLTCYATESLKAFSSGSGDIRYKGDPKQIEKSKRGVSKM